MSHALTKLLPALALSLAMLAMTGCSKSPDAQAQPLLDQAQTALDAGRYQEAIALVDSLRAAYPRAIDVRRRSLHVLARAQEGRALAELAEADSLVARLTVETSQLQEGLKKVDNPIEPYYIDPATDPADVRRSTGLQARMTPDGQLYLIASLKGVNAQSTAVSVAAADGSAARTPDVAFDGERNDRSGDMETITFVGAEAEEVAKFIATRSAEPLTLIFAGGREYKTTLPPAQAAAIARVYRCASTLRALRVASVEKERASRALDLARSQAARTFVETPDAESK